jgi:peptidoglycan/xylan/chitin deacetylase (PgdA/CDA1 family)
MKLHSLLKKVTFQLAGPEFMLRRQGLVKPVILFYHGVTRVKPKGFCNIEGKHVFKDRFAKQMRAIKRYFHVVSLDELLDSIENRSADTRLVTITFDDGFYNNYEVAAPILADLDMPATFFISTGYIGKSRWMWTDLVESSLDRTSEVRCDWGGEIGIPIKTINQKLNLLRRIKSELKKRPLQECEGLIECFCDALKVERIAPYGDYRFMGWREVSELSSSGFGVGAHTVNHPILSTIGFDEAQKEILNSAKQIATQIGHCSDVFCFPNGKPQDYSPELVEICRKNFRAALSTSPGGVHPSEMYELRRLGVANTTSSRNLIWWISNQAKESREEC